MRHLLKQVTALLSVVFLVACTSETPPQEEILRPVRFHTVKMQTISSERSFSGVSVSAKETKLSFRLSGLLEKLEVRVGQRVKKGNLIATLDDWDLQLKYEELTASILNAQVLAGTAQADLERIRELYENDNVSLREYEQAKNAYASAKAGYEVQKKQLDQQKSQLIYTRITSPMNGVVTEVPVAKNENITAGEVVAVLTSSEAIEVEVGVPEAYIAAIKPGMATSIVFSSLPEKKYAGVVSEVAFVAAEYSTYPVTIRLNEQSRELRPGMPAEARFTFSDNNSAIFVPSNAVAEDIEGIFVFLVEKTGKGDEALLRRRRVVVGELTELGFVVTDGLQEGDDVITSGISKVSDGMKVRTMSSLN